MYTTNFLSSTIAYVWSAVPISTTDPWWVRYNYSSVCFVRYIGYRRHIKSCMCSYSILIRHRVSGNRDSEMAIRIEDTAHETITLDNKPFVVGSLPHQVRLRLMHQHLADETIDIVDVLNERFVPLKTIFLLYVAIVSRHYIYVCMCMYVTVRVHILCSYLPDIVTRTICLLYYSIFFNNWRKISNSNSAIYDELDGDTSMYRVHTPQIMRLEIHILCILHTYIHTYSGNAYSRLLHCSSEVWEQKRAGSGCYDQRKGNQR